MRDWNVAPPEGVLAAGPRVAARARLWCTTGALGLLAACGWEPPSSPPPTDTYRLGIKISSETTRLTEPLLPNGAPDYAAAMNATTGMGVTPSNNAVPGVAPVIGMTLSPKIRNRLDLPPDAGSPDSRKRFAGGFSREAFETLYRLRPELPAPADLDAAFEAFRGEQRVLEDGYCSSKACPAMAGWLRSNETALAAIAQAVAKPRYWVPAEEGANLYATPAPDGSPLREVCAALAARAELRLGDDDASGAASDILTVHRLGALLGQSPLRRDQEVAAACIVEGNEALRRLATGPVRDVASATSLLKALDPLPQIGNFELVVQHERFKALAGIFLLREIAEQKGAAAWRDALEPEVGQGARPDGFYRLTISSIDWNLAVSLVNRSWDLVREFLWSPDERREEARKSLEDWMKWTEETRATLDESRLSKLIENVDRDADARPAITRAFVDAAGFLPRGLTGFMRSVNEPLAGRELGLLALALAVYRAQTGKLPPSVDALVPGYLERIPPARQFGHVLRVVTGSSPELSLTLVPEIVNVTGSASYCVDTEGRNVVLADGHEPKVVEGRCQPPSAPESPPAPER